MNTPPPLPGSPVPPQPATQSAAADSRIEVIRRSMKCFAFGWLALVPLFGLPFAVHGLSLFRAVRRESAGMWNPAANHLLGGAALSVAGIVLTVTWVGIVANGAINGTLPGLGECVGGT
jgi:hypothetical protein